MAGSPEKQRPLGILFLGTCFCCFVCSAGGGGGCERARQIARARAGAQGGGRARKDAARPSRGPHLAGNEGPPPGCVPTSIYIEADRRRDNCGDGDEDGDEDDKEAGRRKRRRREKEEEEEEEKGKGEGEDEDDEDEDDKVYPSVCFDSSFARISLSSASAHCHIARANAPGRGGDRPRIPPVSRARAPGPASPPKLQRSCDSTEEEDGEEVERAGAEKGTRRAKRARQRRKRKERARTSKECIWRDV